MLTALDVCFRKYAPNICLIHSICQRHCSLNRCRNILCKTSINNFTIFCNLLCFVHAIISNETNLCDSIVSVVLVIFVIIDLKPIFEILFIWFFNEKHTIWYLVQAFNCEMFLCYWDSFIIEWLKNIKNFLVCFSFSLFMEIWNSFTNLSTRSFQYIDTSFKHSRTIVFWKWSTLIFSKVSFIIIRDSIIKLV